MSKTIQIVHEGPIFRNPMPGYEAKNAYYANMAVISDDEIVCVNTIGQALYALDRRLTLSRSLDGGRTWNEEGLIWDTAKDDRNYAYTLGWITRLRDGSMVMATFRHERIEKDKIRHNPETGGLPPEQYVLMHSTDNGRTWTRPQLINYPPPGQPAGLDLCSPIVELADGRWLLPCNVWKAWDDPTPLHMKYHYLFSSDRGKTWGDRVNPPSASEKDKMYSHGRFMRMKDNRLCALQWAQAIGGQQSFDLHIEFGDPTGKTWTNPRPTGLPGESSWIEDCGDGCLIAIYTCRSSKRPGIYAAISEDDGKTWNMDNQLRLFDATGREFFGLDHPPTYPASHDNVAYGMPCAKRLPCGDIMAHWWSTAACVTQTRYARLQVK